MGAVNKTVTALAGGLFSFDCFRSKAWQLLKGNQGGGRRKVKSFIVPGFYRSLGQLENSQNGNSLMLVHSVGLCRKQWIIIESSS